MTIIGNVRNMNQRQTRKDLFISSKLITAHIPNNQYCFIVGPGFLMTTK